jgi:hypothetical protein
VPALKASLEDLLVTMVRLLLGLFYLLENWIKSSSLSMNILVTSTDGFSVIWSTQRTMPPSTFNTCHSRRLLHRSSNHSKDFISL